VADDAALVRPLLVLAVRDLLEVRDLVVVGIGRSDLGYRAGPRTRRSATT